MALSGGGLTPAWQSPTRKPPHERGTMPDVTYNKLLGLLKSRKFWAAIVALVLSVLGERAGLDHETITSAVLAIVTYIIGVALEDGLSRR